MAPRRSLIVLGLLCFVWACGDDLSAGGGGAGPIGGADSHGGGGEAATGGMGGGAATGGTSEGGSATGGAGVGPYINCEKEAVPCPTEGAICPNDSTGSVCAPPCETVSDCPMLAGAVNPPDCYEIPLGKFCVIPCSVPTDCPTDMQCLFIGLEPQCGWE